MTKSPPPWFPVVFAVQGSMSVFEQLCTHPSPNSILIWTCYQLTIVGLWKGKYTFAQILTLVPI